MKREVLMLLVAAATMIGCDAPMHPAAAAGAHAEVRVVGPSETVQALDARCTADVAEVGSVDVESDYLPHVIACENGAASFEALKAQAVAARSYLYYKAAAYPNQPILDGEGDQVYTCLNAPLQIHYDAVAATAGEVLTYAGTEVAAFYVAGAIPTSATCEALPGDDDYSETEHFVTYNWGRRALGVEQTTLGWVNAGNFANRGAQSQNAADCLSDDGWDYEDILRSFYGMDIVLEVAEGACVSPTPAARLCGAPLGEAWSLIDDSDPCFFLGCVNDDTRFEIEAGAQGGALLSPATADTADCVGRWQLAFDGTADRRVMVHIAMPPGAELTQTYLVRHAGMTTTVDVSPSAEGWVDLGVFLFEEGRHQYIELADDVGLEGDSVDGPWVVFDAVALGHPDAPFPFGGPDVGSADGGSAGQPDDAGPDTGEAQADGGLEPGGDGADAGPGPELPPSVQECACAAVPDDVPWTPLVGFMLTLLMARGARRRMPSSPWRPGALHKV